jgi:glycerophosphoryl diester phosphodiesterase
MHKLFQYTGDSVFFLSSHRGGPESNFSENCIETFENTLNHTYSMMECDPRYTKDSVIILHHDATLDRTTSGHGKVSDFTLEELKALNLKDMRGNETSYKIPTLDYALEWAKGKTILVLDKKDVPIEERVKKITEHKAEANSIVMAYNFEEAKRCHQLNKNIMIQIFINSPKKIQEFEKFGVPWKNVVVFVGHSEPVAPALYDMIHQKGALCILGTSRNIDKRFTNGEVSNMEELRDDYNVLFSKGVDIIETDIPVSVSLIFPETPQNKILKIIK